MSETCHLFLRTYDSLTVPQFHESPSARPEVSFCPRGPDPPSLGDAQSANGIRTRGG